MKNNNDITRKKLESAERNLRRCEEKAKESEK